MKISKKLLIYRRVTAVFQKLQETVISFPNIRKNSGGRLNFVAPPPASEVRSWHPVGDKNVELMRARGISGRREHELGSISRNHGKTVEARSAGQPLQPGAVSVHYVQGEAAALGIVEIGRKNDLLVVRMEKGRPIGGAVLCNLSLT